MRAEDIEPQVSWGTSPEMVTGISGQVPDPADSADDTVKGSYSRALEYMGLAAKQKITDIRSTRCSSAPAPTRVSRTCVRPPRWPRASKVADSIMLAMVVPGSGLVKRQAEAEGLDKIFTEAGFEWREPGCSMCWP